LDVYNGKFHVGGANCILNMESFMLNMKKCMFVMENCMLKKQIACWRRKLHVENGILGV
jgi:hypothetical protein